MKTNARSATPLRVEVKSDFVVVRFGTEVLELRYVELERSEDGHDGDADDELVPAQPNVVCKIEVRKPIAKPSEAAWVKFVYVHTRDSSDGTLRAVVEDCRVNQEFSRTLPGDVRWQDLVAAIAEHTQNAAGLKAVAQVEAASEWSSVAEPVRDTSGTSLDALTTVEALLAEAKRSIAAGEKDGELFGDPRKITDESRASSPNFVRARECVARAIAMDSGTAARRFYAAWLAVREWEWSVFTVALIKELEILAKAEKKDAALQLELGKAYQRAYKEPKAATVFKKLATATADPHISYLFAICTLTSDPAAAIQSLDRAIARRDDARFRLARATTAAAFGDVEQALADWARARELGADVIELETARCTLALTHRFVARHPQFTESWIDALEDALRHEADRRRRAALFDCLRVAHEVRGEVAEAEAAAAALQAEQQAQSTEAHARLQALQHSRVETVAELKKNATEFARWVRVQTP